LPLIFLQRSHRIIPLAKVIDATTNLLGPPPRCMGVQGEVLIGFGWFGLLFLAILRYDAGFLWVLDINATPVLAV